MRIPRELWLLSSAPLEVLGPLNLEFTGLSQNLGQLEGSYRDFQSNCWVNLQILGQPCEFYLLVHLVPLVPLALQQGLLCRSRTS
jgi:hypothetical protein